MFTTDVLSRIQYLLQTLNPSSYQEKAVLRLPQHEELDIFFFNKILSNTNETVSQDLTIDQLRQMEKYPCYMVKKTTYGPNENKVILFGINGQTLGEFTFNPKLHEVQECAEVVAYLEA